ncbi:MAG: glycine--tRNA ligase subunit beta [Nitrospira sp.]|nr:glycine--tRNA ligase subunit beta [Nitrospira sp.]
MATQKQAGRRSTAPKKGRGTSASAVAELLLEIGVEELPSQFIVPALVSLKESAERLFNGQRLTFQSVRTMGTPCRLTIMVDGLAPRQAFMTKEAMGPSKAVAFDQAGQPTKAALGFAAGQGVPVQDLQIRHTPKGEYLFAVKREEGRSSAAVLIDTLPQLVSGLTFPKAMKWNETGVRFARPVRWIMALYGGLVLPIEAAGIKASNETKGHRVLGGGKWVSVRDATSYIGTLERQGVIVDPQRRRKLIEEQIADICHKTGLQLNEDEVLLEQAIYSTEQPVPVIGSFKDAYLDVPEEILMTSMKEHQGFFSLRRKNTGQLASHFIAVANNRAKDMSLIREGNERVLAARLADAKFFFDEDQKVTLEERAKKLSGVIFHHRLGTMARKQERVEKLVGAIAEQMSLESESRSACIAAARLCKADLLSGIVGEFPELQGVMGGYYAQHDGMPQNVCKAIRDQYIPRGMDGALPETVEGRVLGVADRLDTIAAFYQAGIIPKGSEDPFALRRHALSVVRILLEGNLKLDLGQAVANAGQIVEADVKPPPSIAHDPLGFIIERFRYYMGTTENLRDDVIQAVTGYDAKECDVVDLAGRMRALQATTSLPEFDPLMVGFNRANNILKKEGVKKTELPPVNPSLFHDDAEHALHAQLKSMEENYGELIRKTQYKEALHYLVQLKPYIDRFFESVMVNVEDPTLRNNRLSLLRYVVDEFFGKFADFSQIVVQGR